MASAYQGEQRHMFGHDNQDNHQDETHEDDKHHQPAAQDDSSVIAPSDSDKAAHETVPGEVAEPIAASSPTAPSVAADDLLSIKQDALEALTPLVDQLDQTPEEQFRTTMMMIQASDNNSLIKVAYQAAKKISDEKERAQALLDIVNEINYFTQQSQV